MGLAPPKKFPDTNLLNCMLVLDWIAEIMNPYQIPFLLNYVIVDQVKLMMTKLLLKDLWQYIVMKTVLAYYKDEQNQVNGVNKA